MIGGTGAPWGRIAAAISVKGAIDVIPFFTVYLADVPYSEELEGWLHGVGVWVRGVGGIWLEVPPPLVLLGCYTYQGRDKGVGEEGERGERVIESERHRGGIPVLSL